MAFLTPQLGWIRLTGILVIFGGLAVSRAGLSARNCVILLILPLVSWLVLCHGRSDIKSTTTSGHEIITEVRGRTFLHPFGIGGTVIGSTAPGWESVRVGFENNFAQNLELGAQLVVYHGNSKVVDLVGHSSKQPGYTAETLQCVFSSGKNMEAVVLAMLVDRGLVKYDDAVSKHWPEFGQHGKQDVTLADVMRHEAGLSYFSKPGDPKTPVLVTKAMLMDLDMLETTMADSGLNMPVGERCYHALTRGWIVSAVVRRVDPKQRTLGMFLREEVCEPLGITYFCGIPGPEQANYKLADLTFPPKLYTRCCEELPDKLGFGDKQRAVFMAAVAETGGAGSVPAAEWMVPPSPHFTNTPEGRAAEIPSAGMYTNARSMAKVNACMANGGKLGGVRIMSEKACTDSMAFVVTKQCKFLHSPVPFSQGGFSEYAAMPPSNVSRLCNGFFGWGGWGGSLSIFNPEKGIAVSYTMTGMGNDLGVGFKARFDNLMSPVASIISQ